MSGSACSPLPLTLFFGDERSLPKEARGTTGEALATNLGDRVVEITQEEVRVETGAQ